MTRMSRRQRIKLVGSAAGLSVLPGVLRAAQYVLTPPQTEGPFYPERIPLDSETISRFLTPILASGLIGSSVTRPTRFSRSGCGKNRASRPARPAALWSGVYC